jgi:transcriptional regulator with XRE-family HTH domain
MLRTARRRAGITQRELARRAGVPQPTVSRIERGVVSPSVDTLDRLLRHTGMELDVLEQPRETDVDRTLIRELLKMTSSERGRYAANAANEMQRLLVAQRGRA